MFTWLGDILITLNIHQLCINIDRDIWMITFFRFTSYLTLTFAYSDCVCLSLSVFLHAKVHFDYKARNYLYYRWKWYWHHNELANKQKLNEEIKSILETTTCVCVCVSIALNQRKSEWIITSGSRCRYWNDPK